MKAKYKGYEIEVKREKCMGGWFMTYYTIYRISDGYEAVCDFTEDESPVREQMQWMKDRIDEELKSDNPWDENDDPNFLRKGTCEMCGEPDIDLYEDDMGVLPEEFEGVGCQNCIGFHAEEDAARARREDQEHEERQGMLEEELMLTGEGIW